ncbi:hypothetical protein FBEOM_2760 [Fusarium beomiforme]|uniref:Uncharacterized protein n=1 Tax=Fusarium beomiforme TaxID=44412 RepID=A0A9P5AR87_9HYPO|nr:hypothetical protein FBEOM_2760 [Fusarium beomiforme]
MPPSFTFVNVSNAPGLGPKEAKQMRGHITKTNFAKRRQRLAKEKKRMNILQSADNFSAVNTSDELQAWQALKPGSDRLLMRLVDPIYSPVEYCKSSSSLFLEPVAYNFSVLSEYRALIFPAGLGTPGSSREADWISLLHSEPALVEASMAIALRHSPRTQNAQSIRESSLRKCRAIKLINARLGTPLELTDGVLSAVFTLTFAELLESDSEARDVHVQGLAQMIKVRRSLGNTALPSWFGDFILYDSIGHAILSASYSNLPLINALRNEDDPEQIDVAMIRQDANDLRQLIDKYHASTTLKRDTAAIIRLCSSMQLLVWQLFVGAAAAGPASEIRSCEFIANLDFIRISPLTSTMGPDSTTQDPPSPAQKTSGPITLVFDGQRITSEDAPTIPLYQLSRSITCNIQKHCSIIFEQIEIVETRQPDGTNPRTRHRTHDLYYLVNSLLMLHRRHDTPTCYLTAPSPKALGNVQVDICEASSPQSPTFRAMLNADRTADDVQLFNPDTQQTLFNIRQKVKGGHYQWVGADEQIVAYESGQEGEHKLVVQAPLQNDIRDVLVALWTLRLWYNHVDGQIAR